jgi:hypothetical protein
MAFIVEDGTGVLNANSYGTVEGADAYFAERGNGEWSALTTQRKQECLILATDYMEQRFSNRYIGISYVDGQSLSWPRNYTGFPHWNINVIPRNLTYACYEYAYRASKAVLAPDPVVDASGATTIKTLEKVGPITREFAAVGGDYASTRTLRPYPAADMYLKGLVYSGSGVYR